MSYYFVLPQPVRSKRRTVYSSSFTRPATPDVAAVCDVRSSGPCEGRWVYSELHLFKLICSNPPKQQRPETNVDVLWTIYDKIKINYTSRWMKMRRNVWVINGQCTVVSLRFVADDWKTLYIWNKYSMPHFYPSWAQDWDLWRRSTAQRE